MHWDLPAWPHVPSAYLRSPFAQRKSESLVDALSHTLSVPSSLPPSLYSVVYTDRALNHMSEPFKKVMNDISDTRMRHAAPVPLSQLRENAFSAMSPKPLILHTRTTKR